MSKMDFLDSQEAEKINTQKSKPVWWTPCIVAYFQNQRTKAKHFTQPVNILLLDISKFYSFSENMACFLALIFDSSTS